MKKTAYAPREGISRILDFLYPQEVRQDADHGGDTVIFSHLRWESLTRRPHHTASLLARDRNILFVENPVAPPEGSNLPYRIYRPAPHITVLQPYSRQSAGEYDYSGLINTFLQYTSFSSTPVYWLYSPVFVNSLHYLEPSLVVYEITDSINRFGFDRGLAEKEQMLISLADVVFTESEALCEYMRTKHDHVFFVPGSVDAKHFAKAHDPETVFPHDLLEIPLPRVGYVGPVDENIDLGLIKKIADLLPSVSFVFIGPIMHLDEKSLPSSKNIHFLGERDYSLLPNYLKGIDVAFMPIVMDEKARYLSSSRALQPIAAKKPIVSTPVRSMADAYRQVMRFAENSEEAIREITGLLNENASSKDRRMSLEEEIISRTSWEKAVDDMKRIAEDALEERTIQETDISEHTVFKLKLS